MWWWTNSFCTSADEDLGTLAEYDHPTVRPEVPEKGRGVSQITKKLKNFARSFGKLAEKHFGLFKLFSLETFEKKKIFFETKLLLTTKNQKPKTRKSEARRRFFSKHNETKGKSSLLH